MGKPLNSGQDSCAAIAADLATEIGLAMKDAYTHERLSGEIAALGLEAPMEGSKRERVAAALDGLAPEEVARIAVEAGRRMGKHALWDRGERVLEDGTPSLSEITRRDVARCFGDDVAGARDIVEMLRPLFALDAGEASFLDDSLEEDLRRRTYGGRREWDAERVFEEIGALSCSRTRFGKLLAAALHPLARRGDAQAGLVARINAVLARDGYRLVEDGAESGHPLFRMGDARRGVAGPPKNLVFASVGPKPRIGFADAINNDIVILEHAGSCLVYDRPIGSEGLRWTDLVEWWRAARPEDPEPAKSLGARLMASLASEGEKAVFRQYFRQFRESLGDALPALVPQVYLHYDPATVRQLAGRDGLVRQRMDFLALLPNRQRIVLEVDGRHHFATPDGKACLATYAAMASADRDLRLAGYEVYRIAATEVVGPGAEGRIGAFFSCLFELHGVARR